MTRIVAALIIVCIIGYVLARIGRAIRAQWFIVRSWRFLSGQAHHGKPITDAGWFRKGVKPLTPTGHATRFWHLPRWKRAGIRSGGTFAFMGVLAGLLVNPLVTGLMVGMAVAGLFALAAWRVRQRVIARRERRTWLYPLHLAAHELAGYPRAIRASSWLSVETSPAGAVTWARLDVAGRLAGRSSGTKKRLEVMAAAKLGIENAEPKWRQAGPVPLLTLVHSPPPPGHLRLADVLRGDG